MALAAPCSVCFRPLLQLILIVLLLYAVLTGVFMLQDSCLCLSCRKLPGSLFQSMKGVHQRHITSIWMPVSVGGAWHTPCQGCAREALSWGCIWRFRLIEDTQKSHQASHRHLPRWRGTEEEPASRASLPSAPSPGEFWREACLLQY